MRIEVRCQQCGRGYLIDEGRIPAGGGFVPCQSCGATIELSASPAKAKPPAAPQAPPPATAEVCCPRCNFHFIPDAAAQASRSGRPTLLVVEDMDYFIEIAKSALGARYELKVARSLAEARPILVKGGIDLLLLDVTLDHGEDGLRLLREPPGKTCPVLLFTAQDESEMYGEGWAKLQALGVDDVVMKGMNMDEMLARKVAELLGEPLTEDSLRR